MTAVAGPLAGGGNASIEPKSKASIARSPAAPQTEANRHVA
jgi:hypothetical protein